VPSPLTIPTDPPHSRVHLVGWRCLSRRQLPHQPLIPTSREELISAAGGAQSTAEECQVAALTAQARVNKPCLHQPCCPIRKRLRERAQNLNEFRLFLDGFYNRVFSPA